MTKKPIAFFDLDNTLCDYDSAIKRDYNDFEKPEYPAYDPANKNIPELRKFVDELRSKPNWWLNLEPYEQGFDILKICVEIGFEPHILTKGPRNCQNSWTEKLLWCQKYLPGVPVTITQDKSITRGHLLVDDYPPYLEEWLEKNQYSWGIMPLQTYNSYFDHERVFEYHGAYDDLYEKISMIYLKMI